MNETRIFKRLPAINCWIKHLEKGYYDENEKFFHTIFGKVKRVRIIATIIEKKESVIESMEEEQYSEENIYSNIRLDFDLDDGTGLIRGFIRNINPEVFHHFNKGDIVDVIGRVSKYGDFISLWIEIMKKVENPNKVLLRSAEIIKRLKNGDIHEIPVITEIGDNIDDFSNEIEIDTFFEEENDTN